MSRNASRPIFLDETGNKRKVAPVYEVPKVSLYRNWPQGEDHIKVNPTLYFNTDLSDPIYGQDSDMSMYYKIEFKSVEGDSWTLDVGVSMPDIQITDDSGIQSVFINDWEMSSYSMTGQVYIESISGFSANTGIDAVLLNAPVDVDPEYNYIHKADKEDVPELYSGTTKVSKVTFSVSGSTLTITTE